MTALNFQHTWEWVVGVSPHTGEPKTQTAQLVLPGQTADPYHEPTPVDQALYMSELGFFETIYNPSGSVKWTLGCTRAVKSGRARPAVRWSLCDGEVVPWAYDPEKVALPTAQWKWVAEENGFREARVQIDVLRRMDVRCYTRKEWWREGFKLRDQFLFVWTELHDFEAFAEYPGAAPDDMSADPALVHDWCLWLLNRPKRHYDAWVINYHFLKD